MYDLADAAVSRLERAGQDARSATYRVLRQTIYFNGHDRERYIGAMQHIGWTHYRTECGTNRIGRGFAILTFIRPNVLR